MSGAFLCSQCSCPGAATEAQGEDSPLDQPEECVQCDTPDDRPASEAMSAAVMRVKQKYSSVVQKLEMELEQELAPSAIAAKTLKRNTTS